LLKTQKDFFNAEDSSMYAYLMHPFLQTSYFISETTNLAIDQKNANNYIKLIEGSGRKDRYSSVSMANYLASIYDKNLLKEEDVGDDWDIISILTQVW
jgi:hypothetical protein